MESQIPVDKFYHLIMRCVPIKMFQYNIYYR